MREGAGGSVGACGAGRPCLQAAAGLARLAVEGVWASADVSDDKHVHGSLRFTRWPRANRSCTYMRARAAAKCYCIWVSRQDVLVAGGLLHCGCLPEAMSMRQVSVHGGELGAVHGDYVLSTE